MPDLLWLYFIYLKPESDCEKTSSCFFSQIWVSHAQASPTYPTERHHVESVRATIELIEEVTVGVLGGVINLQLAAWSPVEEMQINIVKLRQSVQTKKEQGKNWHLIYRSKLSTTDHMPCCFWSLNPIW